MQVEIISKRSGPRRLDAVGSPPPGPDRDVSWIADRRAHAPWAEARGGATPLWYDIATDDLEDEARAEPRHRVRVGADRVVRVVEGQTGRRLHALGEIRLLGRVWRFVLATRENGFPAALNSAMAARLAQLDGAPMGGPRTNDALAAEISSLLGYDAHR